MKESVNTTVSLPVRFRCLDGCGMCCSYKVGLTGDEVQKIERAAELDFLRTEGNFLKKKGGYCVFLNEKARCGIYRLRPLQCQTYPFYVEPGQIDIDLSCPGIGKGDTVDESVFKSLEKCASSSEAERRLFPESPLPQWPDGRAVCRDLAAHSVKDSEREVAREFLVIRNGCGTHIENGEVTIFEFSLNEDVVQIDNKSYALARAAVFPELKGARGKIILSYVSLWLKRNIFRDFITVSALLTSASKRSLTLSVLKRMVEILFAVEKAFVLHWEDVGSGEEPLREAIRAVDGRLRENCKKVNVALAAAKGS